jgi:microsomal epoxide hydrolase
MSHDASRCQVSVPGRQSGSGSYTTLNTRVLAGPKKVLFPPRSVASRLYTDIRRLTRMERGGHFPALEQPLAPDAEIREFYRALWV